MKIRNIIGGAALVAMVVLLAMGTATAGDIEGVRVSVQAWEQAALSNEDSAVIPGGRISADGPLALGSAAPFRLYARFDITSMPGQSFDPTNLATFGRSASLRLGSYRQIGRLKLIDQEVTTAIVVESGFETALRGEVLPRYVRHVGGGIRFDERTSGAYLSILGARRGGVWDVLISAAVPLTAAKGVVVFGGDAVLSVGQGGSDMLLLRTAVDINALVGLFGGSKKP